MKFMRNRAITDYKTSTSGAIGTGRGPRWWYLKAPRRARQERARQESAQSKSIRQSSGSSTHFFRPASSACENHSSSTSTIDRRGAQNRRAASRCGYLRARVTFGTIGIVMPQRAERAPTRFAPPGVHLAFTPSHSVYPSCALAGQYN